MGGSDFQSGIGYDIEGRFVKKNSKKISQTALLQPGFQLVKRGKMALLQTAVTFFEVGN